jgi:hypothetical protein
MNKLNDESSATKKVPIRFSLDKATQYVSGILAPILIINFLREVHENIEYIIKHPLLATFFLLFFASIFLYNIFRHIDFDLLRKPNFKAMNLGYFKSLNKKKLFVAGGIIASFSAVVLIIIIYITVFVSGLYYVAIASAPNKSLATNEVLSINNFLAKNGITDLKARAYSSTATGSYWYMITIGGFHFSKRAANNTLNRAKQILGDRMRDDAYIYSTSNASPARKLRFYIKKLLT